MPAEQICEETTGSGGAPLPCREAWDRGCRCEACVTWRSGEPDDPAPPAEGHDPTAHVERDPDSGQFKSTELTRSLHRAVEEAGGSEALYGFVKAGLSAREILKALGMEQTGERAQWAVYRELNKNPERYEKAKIVSADAHAEKAGEVFGDEAPDGLTSAEAKWIADKSGWHRWMAEMRSGQQRGGVNVNVDLGQLYLGVLREHGRMDRNPDRVARSEPVEAEYEIQEEPEGSDTDAEAET